MPKPKSNPNPKLKSITSSCIVQSDWVFNLYRLPQAFFLYLILFRSDDPISNISLIYIFKHKHHSKWSTNTSYTGSLLSISFMWKREGTSKHSLDKLILKKIGKN